MSKKRSVTSGQQLVDPSKVIIWLNIFIYDIGSGIKCTLSKFTNDSKLCDAVLHKSGGMLSGGTLTGLKVVPQ